MNARLYFREGYYAVVVNNRLITGIIEVIIRRLYRFRLNIFECKEVDIRCACNILEGYFVFAL